jgi:hypothetical protein
MQRLKNSIEVGAKLLRMNELLSPLNNADKLEVQYGYDVIDYKNYNESFMENKIDLMQQSNVGPSNPFLPKINSEILVIDFMKIAMAQAVQLAESLTNLVPVKIHTLNFVGNEITDIEFK